MYPLPPGKKLAVPPMHPDVPADVRAKVLDFIERRLFVDAWNLAEDAEDERCWRESREPHIGKELATADRHSKVVHVSAA